MNIRFKIKSTQYVLTSDSRNFILGIEGGKKRAQVKDHTYFSTIGGLLGHLYGVGLKNNDVTSFRDLTKHSEEIKGLVARVEQQLSFQGT